jgi:hypothetical protein
MKALIDKKVLNIKISKNYNPVYELSNILADQNLKS